MNIYPLDRTFQRQDLIEEFHSIIWTERLASPGEVELIVPATKETYSQLAPGTFLAIDGSKEVMEIETRNIEDNLLKVTGPSLLDIFNRRFIRSTAQQNAKNWVLVDSTEASAIATIVQEMCIDGIMDSGSALGGWGVREIIPNLILGDIALGGDFLSFRPIEYGPVYPALKKLSDAWDIGMSLYLDHADSSGYQLKFRTWFGVDKTRDSGDVNLEKVVFSPAMDSFTNIKELISIKGYKNVCYAFATAEDVVDMAEGFGSAFADPASATSMGFDRRSMMVLVEDFKSSDVETTTLGFNDILDILNQRARDALANNNYTKIVDGEIVPQSGYTYGVHYGLGDIVELQGISGGYQRALITEYIRTHDATGEKAYPTVSVIS